MAKIKHIIMEKLNEIKEAYAVEIGYKDWDECINDQPNYRIETLMDEVALRFGYDQIKETESELGYKPVFNKSLLNKVIEKASVNLSKITNVDSWLDDIRCCTPRAGAVMRSVFAVIPDAERLDIGSNKIIAVFQHRHQAEEWAKSMWEKFYLIEEVNSEHFS